MNHSTFVITFTDELPGLLIRASHAGQVLVCTDVSRGEQVSALTRMLDHFNVPATDRRQLRLIKGGA